MQKRGFKPEPACVCADHHGVHSLNMYLTRFIHVHVPTQQDVAVVNGRDVLLPVPDGAVRNACQAAENQQAHQPCSAPTCRIREI